MRFAKVLSAAVGLWFGLLVGIDDAAASTYFISPTGADSNDGLDKAAPWKTWAWATAHSTCGDTLMAMDGAYSIAVHGRLTVEKMCTARAPYTVRAENERAAFLNGDGSRGPILISKSAYVTVDGLRVRSANNAAGQAESVVVMWDTSHITLRRLLVAENNTYFYTHMVQLTNTVDSLVEECEVYSYYGHGFITTGTSARNIFRRNYAHQRGYTGVGAVQAGGDAFVSYPGSDNIFENNIAEEALSKGFAVLANGAAKGNRFLGNVSIGGPRGMNMEARESGDSPRDTTVKDMVVLDATSPEGGYQFHSAINAHCDQCSALGGASGIFVAQGGQPGEGGYSFYSTNSLVAGTAGIGILVSPGVTTWTISNSNAYGNASSNYSPSSSTNYSPNPGTSVDPALGNCYVWIPDRSPMKGAGDAGADIGANILYRYQDGILSNVQLWDEATGEFPHGAVVAGVNDVAGESLFDVHQRLHVNTDGCPFPAAYAGGRDAMRPSPPGNLAVR